MKIVVLDGYTLNPGDNPWDPIARLGELTVHPHSSHRADETVERAGGARIVLTNKTPLTREVLGQLPELQYVGVLATGYNVVDLTAARERGIVVTNIPVYGTDSVAQHTIALLLELCQHVGEHDAAVRAGQWQGRGEFCFWLRPLVELAGMTMGIVGFGRIGRRVGEIAHALGMKVLATGVRRKDAPAYEPFGWVTEEEVFAQADVVSLHCPLNETNRGMVNHQRLERMKPSAFLINTARGGLVNERDLAAALNVGRIAGAAVDVVGVEPIRDDNPLLTARNCLITPHMAWGTLAARRRLMAQAAGNIAAFLEGRPVNRVN